MVVMVTLVDAAKETRAMSQSGADVVVVVVGFGVRPRTEATAVPLRALTNHIEVLLSGDVSQQPPPKRRQGVEEGWASQLGNHDNPVSIIMSIYQPVILLIYPFI